MGIRPELGTGDTKMDTKLTTDARVARAQELLTQAPGMASYPVGPTPRVLGPAPNAGFTVRRHCTAAWHGLSSTPGAISTWTVDMEKSLSSM
jgi:hypothetical protein